MGHIHSRRKDYEEKRRLRKEYDIAKRKLERGILAFFKDEGMVDFYTGLDTANYFVTDIDWGHRHGDNIDIDETVLNYNYPAKEDDWI